MARGFLIRERVFQFRFLHHAATIIQAQWKGYRVRDMLAFKKMGGPPSNPCRTKTVLRSICHELNVSSQRIQNVEQSQNVHEKALRMLWNEVGSIVGRNGCVF